MNWEKVTLFPSHASFPGYLQEYFHFDFFLCVEKEPRVNEDYAKYLNFIFMELLYTCTGDS